jgi:hypothetical protein
VGLLKSTTGEHGRINDQECTFGHSAARAEHRVEDAISLLRWPAQGVARYLAVVVLAVAVLNPLQCLTSQGVTSQSGTVVLEIAVVP